MTYNTLVVLLGAGLLGMLCGSVGCFAVLKRRALLGDAMAHASLPGIVLIFWATQSKSLSVLLLGALISGLLGIMAIAIMRRYSITKEDAAIGLVLSVFFGAGIALSRYVQGAVEGGSKAGLDTYILGKTAGIVRSDVIGIACVAAFSLLVVILCYKEFRLVSFDTDFARSLGWKTIWIDFAIMGLVALAVTVGLPMVGVVMIAALTILPAVSARFFTSKLSVMLVLAALSGLLSAIGGVLLSSSHSDMPTGPMIILWAGGLFVIAAMFAPHRGLIANWIRIFRFRMEHSQRTLLLELLKQPLPKSKEALTRLGLYVPGLTLGYAGKAGHLTIKPDSIEITPEGKRWIETRRKNEQEEDMR